MAMQLLLPQDLRICTQTGLFKTQNPAWEFNLYNTVKILSTYSLTMKNRPNFITEMVI